MHLRALRNGAVATLVTALAGFALNAMVGSGGSPVAADSPTPRPTSSPPCAPRTEPLDRAALLGLAGGFEDVWFDGPDDGWAVGSNGDPETEASAVLAHWDGSAWTPSPDVSGTSNIEVLRGVDGSDPADVWAVGWTSDGSIRNALAVRFDGASWEPSDAPTGVALFDVRTLAADDVWAVGSAGNPAIVQERAIALHWDGSLWTRTPLPVGGGRSGLNAIAGTTGDLWAVGYHHHGPLLMHYDGTRWARSFQLDARGPLNAVAEWEGTIWLAGSSVLRGDASAFTQILQAREGGSFTDIVAASAGRAFAVGTAVNADASHAVAVEIDGDRGTPARVRAPGDDGLEAIGLVGDEAWIVGWRESTKGVVPLVATVNGCG
jgi:hypothetical protein